MFDVLEIPAPEGELPHSPRGGSAAERFAECPGSVTLIQTFKSSPSYVEDDPDFRREGTDAHTLGACCLIDGIDCWEADPEKVPNMTADMMGAVQVYVDFARSLPGRMEVEVRFRLPDFHPHFYGTADCVMFDYETLHVIDYKHGVGVVVEAVRNMQLMYYAYGKIASGTFPDDMPVKLTIVQPRAHHHAGPIRTWETTVGYIRNWAETELKPAMEVTSETEYLSLGEWCRFCPAKSVCPAFDGLAKKAIQGGVPITYAEAQQLKMLIKTVEEDTLRRLMAGERAEDVGAKLVKKRSFRVFKGTAPVEKMFGEDAWERKLKGPAAIERLPGGKQFVSEYAFMPEADGYTVKPLNDPSPAASPKTLIEKYGEPSKWLVD